MIQLKAFKYRMYPDKEQEQFLLQNLGCARFVWNALTKNFNSWQAMGPNPRVNEKTLKDMEEFAFLQDAISYVLQQKRIDFDSTVKQFFNKGRKKKLGRPRFKKRGGHESFRIPAASMNLVAFEDLEDGLKLPKIKKRVKLIIDREFFGTPKNITVSRNPSGQWFVSVLVEENVEKFPQTGRAVGIDLGLKDLLVFHDGQKFVNPKLFRKNQAKLAKMQRAFARKRRGSNRREKARIRVARQYQKVSNQRNWLYHNLSTRIVREYDIICMENLNVDGMRRNRTLAKAISDASFSTLVSMISYKSRWYGKQFHQVDRYFASTKTCSACGHKNLAMDLGIREWACSSCGEIHDRDINAAINILERGLKDLFPLTSDELTDYRHREKSAGELVPRVLDEMSSKFYSL